MQHDGTPTATDLAWCAVGVVGADALSYLQTQVSQDLLGDDPWPRWSALLNPDGTVLSAGPIVQTAEGLDVVVPEATLPAVRARLNRFRLRSRCTVDDGRAVAGPYRSRRDAIEDGWPGPEEFAAQLVAQSFGQRFVERTISFTKGCFTGQELVGRLDARGSRVPWRLVRARGARLEQLDAVLRSAGPAGPSGVTSAVKDGDGFVALGFAHRSLLEAPVPAGVVLEALA